MPSYILNVSFPDNTLHRIKIWTNGIVASKKLINLLLIPLAVLKGEITTVDSIDILQDDTPTFIITYNETRHEERGMCVRLVKDYQHLVEIKIGGYFGLDYNDAKFYLRNPNINTTLKISVT